MGTILGLDCELFFNSATYAAPTFAACDAVRDANYEIQTALVDASRRGSGGWGQDETTLRRATLNATFVKDKDDVTFMAIQTKFRANESMEIVAYDGGDAAGSDGLDAMWKVETWNETQDLEGVVIIEATFKTAPDPDLTPTFITGQLPAAR